MCTVCEGKLTKAKGTALSAEEFAQVVFDVTHGMFPSDEDIAAMKCPNCKSKKVKRCFSGYDVTGYVSGNGLLDKAGCRREIALHHLTRNDADTGQPLDPYGYMRQVGEVDDLANKIKKSKQPKSKHFDVNPADKTVSQKKRKKL